MQRSIYLRPVGIFPADRETEAEAVWGGLPLAGTGLVFMGLEVIERNAGAEARRMAALGDFFERDWGRNTLAAADLFEAVRSPRPRIAGLALDRPRIMGIVNVTPDSFSDGGRHATTQAAVEHALELLDEGADIVDIGGESTRPGADPVSLQEELDRVIPVIEGLRTRTEARLSIDTRNAVVMREAAAAGADILNDVSALAHDPDAMGIAVASGLPVILMHAQGDPRTMQDNPTYDDVVLDVFDHLERRIATAVAAGIPRTRLVADPGIGFGKSLAHNLQLMASLSVLHGLGVPLLIGASRKRFIGALSGVEAADQRVHGSIAAALAAIAQGAHIVRVHDVAATRQALDVWQAATAGRT